MTPRLRVACCTDWASQVSHVYKCLKIIKIKTMLLGRKYIEIFIYSKLPSKKFEQSNIPVQSLKMPFPSPRPMLNIKL